MSDINRKRNLFLFILLTLICGVVFILDIALGSVNLSLNDIFSGQGPVYSIVMEFRIPKTLTALITGVAISLSGLVMQTMFKNPLADPYILGISSGASLGVAIFLLGSTILPSFLVSTSGWGLIIAAIIGAVSVTLIILLISFRIKHIVSLLIVGIMIGHIAGSFVTILQNYSNPDSLKLFVTWSFGSLQAVTWNYFKIMLPIVILGVIIVFALQKQLNGLLLGEHYAKGLGISIVRIRVFIIIAVALLAGATTAFTGPIAFIGFAVPHIARGLFRTSNHRIIIPATMLCGSIIMILCDLMSTQIPPSGYVLPINSITSLIGAPIIVWLIIKQTKYKL